MYIPVQLREPKAHFFPLGISIYYSNTILKNEITVVHLNFC